MNAQPGSRPGPDLEQALARTLYRHAEDVAPLPTLGGLVLRRGRVVRRRRRLAAAGGVAVGLAVAVALITGVLPVGSWRAAPPPAGDPTVTPTDGLEWTAQPGPDPTGPFLAALPTGRPVQSPLWVRTVDGRTRITSRYGHLVLPAGLTDIEGVLATPTGILLRVSGPGTASAPPFGPFGLYLLRPDNTLVRLGGPEVTGAALSPDGGRIARSISSLQDGSVRIVVGTVAGLGTAADRPLTTLGVRPGTGVIGWTTKGVLLRRYPVQWATGTIAPSASGGGPTAGVTVLPTGAPTTTVVTTVPGATGTTGPTATWTGTVLATTPTGSAGTTTPTGRIVTVSPTGPVGTWTPNPSTGPTADPNSLIEYSWWQPGSAPTRLPYLSVVPIPARPDVVVVHERADSGRPSCWQLLHLDDAAAGPATACGIPEATGYAGPDGGHLALDRDVYDLTTSGPVRRPLGALSNTLSLWEDADHMLATVGDVQVRCDVRRGGCERAPVVEGADGKPVLWGLFW